MSMILEALYLFVRRDFVASFKQRILGQPWYLNKPLLTAHTFTQDFLAQLFAGIPAQPYIIP